MSLFMCPISLSSKSVCPCLSPSVPNQGFSLYFTEQYRKHHWGGVKGTLQKYLIQFYERLNHWSPLTPSNPDNKEYYKHHCLSSNVCMLHSIFMADSPSLGLFSSSICWFWQVITMTHVPNTCITLEWGAWELPCMTLAWLLALASTVFPMLILGSTVCPLVLLFKVSKAKTWYSPLKPGGLRFWLCISLGRTSWLHGNLRQLMLVVTLSS